MIKRMFLFAFLTFVSACSEIEPVPFEASEGHIRSSDSVPKEKFDIPELVENVPIVPVPDEPEQLPYYTVVVNEVPVKELLFAMARDAGINIDIHPDITGLVTINAVEQTLPQILKRISRQVDIRYEYDGNNLYVSRDTPFLRTYKVDYVNMSRDMSSSTTVATQIASTSSATGSGASGGGGNNSTTGVSSKSLHHFWETLVANITAIVTGGVIVDPENSNPVIANPEVGILSVRATSARHEDVQKFIDQVMMNAKRQVLVQATIVEVTLSEAYQAGIDWSLLNKGGVEIISNTLLGAPVASASGFSSFVIRTNEKSKNLKVTVSLLDEFGDVRILSSPQIMVLNNHTALLKVVDNIVYFEVDAKTTSTQGVVATTVNTDAKTVSVGIVMAVTPQIDSGRIITLNVRPTVSRVNGFVTDPNPSASFVDTDGVQVVNRVPQIAVREMESVLRMTDGQIGILGGLMTNKTSNTDAGIPGLKKAGLLGNLFKTKAADYQKTELVVFIKPIIIHNPSIESGLEEYKQYLPENGDGSL